MDDHIFVSLRQKWPTIENKIYVVKDCRHNILGKAFYNGYDFINIEWNLSKKDSLILINYFVTHWAFHFENPLNVEKEK